MINSCPLYISSEDMTQEEQVSEFWNRDDEASDCEEDISDSDGNYFLAL